MGDILRLVKYILPLLIIILIVNLVLGRIYSPAGVTFGVTFSPRYASYLKLDWQKTYLRILDDLKVRHLRIPAYWDILQAESSKYDFSQTDYMLKEARQRGAQVILVLGERQPRWPECHIPVWAQSLSVAIRRQALLEYIQKVVQRYKDDSVLVSWQVENEPFLSYFGEGCDKTDADFLKTEVDLVRSQSNKKIVIADSGELGGWGTSMQLSDIFGTTLYRKVYDKYLGYISYPVPPYFYSLRSDIIRSLFARQNQKTIIVELQAEPWLANGVLNSPNQQAGLLTENQFKDYISFAKQTGFDEAYLWGVEWWYFMAANGHPEYLDYARTLFR